LEKEAQLGETDTDIVADICSVEGCEKPQETRDLCRWHHEEWLGSREAPEEETRRYVAASFRLPDRDVDKAYLGGLLDREGSITRSDPKYGRWQIKVLMPDKEVIDWLYANVGGSLSSYLAKNRTKRSYHWYLSRQPDVRSFLIAVSPYLKVHRKQMKAREALTEIEEKAAAKAAKRRARNGAKQTEQGV
jgi:hypothetical protein